MELSSRVEYAVLALLELASHYTQTKPLTANEIAAIQGIPDRYLDQILMSLRRSGLIKSQRGAKGGYLLAKPPWEITMLEIISDVDGENHQDISNNQITPEKQVLLEIWQKANEASCKVLANYTLQELCQKRDAYKLVNLMYYI